MYIVSCSKNEQIGKDDIIDNDQEQLNQNQLDQYQPDDNAKITDNIDNRALIRELHISNLKAVYGLDYQVLQKSYNKEFYFLDTKETVDIIQELKKEKNNENIGRNIEDLYNLQDIKLFDYNEMLGLGFVHDYENTFEIKPGDYLAIIPPIQGLNLEGYMVLYRKVDGRFLAVAGTK